MEDTDHMDRMDRMDQELEAMEAELEDMEEGWEGTRDMGQACMVGAMEVDMEEVMAWEAWEVWAGWILIDLGLKMAHLLHST